MLVATLFLHVNLHCQTLLPVKRARCVCRQAAAEGCQGPTPGWTVGNMSLEEMRCGVGRSNSACICGAQGAFSVASKAKVPIVPVTLIGTGHLMPNGQVSLTFPNLTCRAHNTPQLHKVLLQCCALTLSTQRRHHEQALSVPK